MKNFKRILALVLAVMMVATSVVAISAAEADEKVVYNAEAITRLNKLGIFQGYNAADMGADDNVTRAQMALFTGRVLTGKVESNYWESYVNDTTFEDIDDVADYYVGAISYAYEQGVVIGKSDVAFDPNGNVTYQEALTMVVRSLGYTGLSYPNGFINKAMKLGLTNGIANVAYGDAAVRGVIATILYNALYAEDSLFADNFNLTSGTYMLVATPTVYVGDAVIPGASINGYIGKELNEGYVAFAPIGNDYRAVNMASKYVYAKTSQVADDIKGNYAHKLGYAYNLTFENDVLTWGDECASKTFVNYGDDREITTTYIDYDHNRLGGYKENFFLTFGNQAYNLVDGFDKDYTAPTSTHDLILYADFGGYGVRVDDYAQCFDAEGNIIDENGNVLLDYIDGAYYKTVYGKYVKATSEEILAAVAHFEDALGGDYAVIENGAVIGTNDTFGGSDVLGVADKRDAVLAIAKNYFCEITAMDYDNDGIYDAAIYVPYYVGTVNQVKDHDSNSYDGNEFTLTGVTTADGKAQLLTGSGANMPNVNDYVFTGKVTTPGSWAWYVYSYNRHTHTIDVKEIAKSVSGKVDWAVKGAVNTTTGIYEDSQVSLGGTVYKVGGWNWDNLLGLKAVRRYDADKIKQAHVDFVGMDMNGDKVVNKDDVSLTYYNGWNDILEFGMTDACKGFKGFVIAGHLVHGLPTLSDAASFGYVIFNAYQSKFALENEQIVVDAIVDTTGEYKTIKINSVDSMEFTELEYQIFEAYCNIFYATLLQNNPEKMISVYSYYFNKDRLAEHQKTPLYKAVERAFIIDRITFNYEDITGEAGVLADAKATLVYAVNGTNADGSYQLRTDISTTAGSTAFTANNIGFQYGVSTDPIIKDKSLIATDADTVFTFVARDGVYRYIGQPKSEYSLDLDGTTKVYVANSDQIMIVDKTRCISEIAIGDTTWTEKVQDIAQEYRVGYHTSDVYCDEALLAAADSVYRCENIARTHKNTWAFVEYDNEAFVATVFNADEVYLVTNKTSNTKIYVEDGVKYYVYSNLYNMIDEKYEESVIFTEDEVAVFTNSINGLFYEDGNGVVGTNYGAIITRDDETTVAAYTPDQYVGYYTLDSNDDLVWNAVFSADLFNRTNDKVEVGTYVKPVKDNNGNVAQIVFDNGVEYVKEVKLVTVSAVLDSRGRPVTNALGINAVEVGDFSKLAAGATVYYTYDSATATLTGYAFNCDMVK